MTQSFKTKASALALSSFVLGAVVALFPIRSALAVCTHDGDCTVCQILYAQDGQVCTYSAWFCSGNGDSGDNLSCI